VDVIRIGPQATVFAVAVGHTITPVLQVARSRRPRRSKPGSPRWRTSHSTCCSV